MQGVQLNIGDVGVKFKKKIVNLYVLGYTTIPYITFQGQPCLVGELLKKSVCFFTC